MFKNVKAAIFDLDGTLVDSMGVWSKIDHEFLMLRGLEVPSDLLDNIVHLNFLDTAKYFKNRFNLKESLEEIMSEWTSMAYNEYSNNIKLKAGAREYLSLLKTKGIKLAIATSNHPDLLKISLKSNEIHDYFESFTTTLEVKRGKNFPDVYLLAAEKLGVKPEECIVFEDIFQAVRGAKAAGMKVVGVFDLHSEHQKEDIISLADHFIYKYEELYRFQNKSAI